MRKIVFLDSYSIGDSSILAIEELGQLTTYLDTKPEELVERCIGAEVVITNKVKLMKPEIDALLPDLKLICVAATGVNNVDTQYAEKVGVVVRNVPAYSTQSVAEATFAFVFALLRQISFYSDYVHSGRYATSGRCFNLDMPIREISGKRWGIIAMGNIGQRVASLASAFGAEVCYYSTSGRNTAQTYPSLSLDELLESCDIITIHAPLNDATQNLISETEIKRMKKTAILINVGRGSIVNEAALARALDNGDIAGAALDVFANEPIEESNPLLKLKYPERFIAAPHSGWSSEEARATLIATIVRNIEQGYK